MKTKQIELLEKYGISNYTVEINHITLNGSLYLGSLTSADKDFLKGTTLNGSLYLGSLTSADKDFLKGTTINGYLNLGSLTSADKDFLKGTTLNGSLNLGSLTSADKDFLNKNIKQLREGYNKKKGYCFFDGILAKVLSVSEKRTYTIYKTHFGFIANRKEYSAHGLSVKKAIQDLEFKILSEKIKTNPIKLTDSMTVEKYRMITGACYFGIQDFMDKNKIPYKIVNNLPVADKPIKVSDLITILEKNNSYGVDKLKSLIK